MIDHVRELNALLAGLCFFGLCYRTPDALKGVASKRLYIALVVFPALVGFGSVYAAAKHFPSGPIAPMFTLAYLALGWILIHWPERLSGRSPDPATRGDSVTPTGGTP